MTYKNTRRGFTLIELLVVVLIIGILAAVALPQYNKAVKKTRLVEAIITLRSLSHAEDVYYLAQGTYTDQLSGLDVEVLNNSQYFEYICYEDNFPSCIAKPRKAGYPALEFVFNKPGYIYTGQEWCQYNSGNITVEHTDKETQEAHDLCKVVGVPLERPARYYLIQF